jgi:hypothetical protein
MKKKVAIFVCDIMNTITAYVCQEELDKMYKELVVELEKIRINNGAEELLFSFSTSDSSLEYLFKYVEELRPHFEGTKINMSTQFMRTGAYNENKNRMYPIRNFNKIEEMKNMLWGLGREYDIVFAGYADDGAHEHGLIDMFMYFKNTELYTFIPFGNKKVSDLVSVSDKGYIYGLVDSISNYNNPNIDKIEEKDHIIIERKKKLKLQKPSSVF